MRRRTTLEERLRHRPDPAKPRSVDRAWLHLVEAGLVSDAPDDLVTETLQAVLEAAPPSPQPELAAGPFTVMLPPVLTPVWAITVRLPPHPEPVVLCGDGTSVAEPHACALLAPALSRRRVGFSCVGPVVFELLEAISKAERRGAA